MAARGLKISRIREYFREAELDEAEVVLTLVQKDVAERKAVTSQPALPFYKKPRKPRTKKDKVGEDYYAKVGPRGQARYASQRTAKGAKARTSTYSARKGQRTYKPHMNTDHKDALYGVMLYRAKMEDRYHYMAAGFAVAEATAGKTAQESFDKAFERFH